MGGARRMRKSSKTEKTIQADEDEKHPADEAEAEAEAETRPKRGVERIQINRAPVLTMWVAVVAERQGYSYQEGLSFGKAIAGMFAHAKGLRLGIYEKEPRADVSKKRKRKQERFDVFGMSIAGKTTKEGLRLAVQNTKPISPSSVESYLRRAFGSNYERVKEFSGLGKSISVSGFWAARTIFICFVRIEVKQANIWICSRVTYNEPSWVSSVPRQKPKFTHFAS